MMATKIKCPTLSMPVRGQLKFNEPMSRHTSWRVGGPAEQFFVPADCDDLAQFMATVSDQEPFEWIGLGSNVLVRDGGIRGSVICTHKGLNALERSAENRVLAAAGVPGAKVARFCVRCGLVGAEFLAGIPGTMGGALAMNAGAFGGETWDIVESVQTVDRAGCIRTRSFNEFTVGYRNVVMPAGEWFVSAKLRLAPGDPIRGKKRINELLQKRGSTQPIQHANAGSVFRNPTGDYAARLLEQAGMKGVWEGKAQVSEQHANFIINRGGASAADIENLIEKMQQRVFLTHGLRLETEVRIIGDDA